MIELLYWTLWVSEMPDCVLDATVVAMANGNIAGRRPGNAFDRRLRVVEQVVRGTLRLRYNSKLLGEYLPLVQEFRNDVIEVFFTLLVDRGVLVKRNTLSRQGHAIAVKRCRWPSHDQHLLAAALGGMEPALFVTEMLHDTCGACIYRNLAIRVERLD